MDRKVFFDAVRADLYRGELNQEQVDGLNTTLDVLEAYDAPIDEAAYDLATAYWETGGKFGRSVESLTYTTAERIREVWPKRFKNAAAAKPYVRSPQKLAEKVYGGRADLGNTEPGDGFLYRGRGWPQLTGRGRYRALGERLAVPLEDNPDLMLEPAVSAAALVIGMREGLFTGKKLGDVLPDRIAARGVINGDVKANGKAIAEIAEDFGRALVKAAYGEKPVQPPAPDPNPEPDVEPVPVTKTIRWGRVALAAVALLALVWFVFFA